MTHGQSTKCREPLSKLTAEMVKTESLTTLLWIAIIVFLLSYYRYRLLGTTSGIHQATSASDRNMGTKVPRGHQNEHFPVIWKNDALLMVLPVHVAMLRGDSVIELKILPHFRRILFSLNAHNMIYFRMFSFKLWAYAHYQL